MVLGVNIVGLGLIANPVIKTIVGLDFEDGRDEVNERAAGDVSGLLAVMHHAHRGGYAHCHVPG